jgi:choline dehydrogenase-like flavoprotein
MKEAYDVIVVGSGAGGGMSAYVLTHAGMKVLMLEAGRDYNPSTETAMFQLPSEAPLHGARTPDKPLGFYDATVDGGWDLPDEPYTVAQGSQFRWWRARMLGGRTNHWGRFSLRFGPHDFKPYSRDGLGFDWPISYEDVAPWYEKVERLIGIAGANAGLENVPDSPPGVLLPPFPLRASEYFVKRGFESMGIPVAPARLAMLTRPHQGRAACLSATPCARGCAIGANFQSTTVLIPPARASGNLQIRTNALVYEVQLDKRGLAKGVSFVDRRTGRHHSARANAVVLGASTCESARILLNSKSALFPQGLANESGLVGRYLTERVVTGMRAQFPVLEKLPPRNDDGSSMLHMYVPWWGYQQQARKELDFPRGYIIEPYGRGAWFNAGPPEMSIGADAAHCTASHGSALRDEMRRKYGTYVLFAAGGEMIPNEDSYMDLDPTVKDRWGIPVVRFHWRWSEHELRQAVHQRRTCDEVIERLGGRVVEEWKALRVGTMTELGATRMGASSTDSVVNQFGQSWSVKNLFIVDGGIFASNLTQPTLTILALSWRNSAYLAQEARAGNI